MVARKFDLESNVHVLCDAQDAVAEEFHEWPNGHCKHVYREQCDEARKHMSNWAMRNTNNHNVNILKKSCLGVLVCTARCVQDNGDGVHLRPAICDKARRKQLGKWSFLNGVLFSLFNAVLQHRKLCTITHVS